MKTSNLLSNGLSKIEFKLQHYDRKTEQCYGATAIYNVENNYLEIVDFTDNMEWFFLRKWVTDVLESLSSVIGGHFNNMKSNVYTDIFFSRKKIFYVFRKQEFYSLRREKRNNPNPYEDSKYCYFFPEIY